MSLIPELGQSDAEVVRRSLSDPEAFGEIFNRHYDSVFKFVARRHGADRAADTTSEVFLAAFRIRKRFDSRGTSCRPWLYGIASNVIGDAIRKQRRDKRVYIAVSQARQVQVQDDVSVENRVTAELLGDVLNIGLGSLVKRDRDVILLKALDDLSYNEIAEALSIPVGTVRSRLNRARKQLLRTVPRTVWDPLATNPDDPTEGSAAHG